MAESKFSTITSAISGLGGLAVGAAGMFLAIGDTSPKSLEQMAVALTQIAENLDSVSEIDPNSAEEASAILIKASEISSRIVRQSSGIELPGVDAVLIQDEPLPVAIGSTQSMLLGTGDRVSVTYVRPNSNGFYTLVVNDITHTFGTGNRLFETEDGRCFIEFLGTNATNDQALIRPACN
ncbi:MAG: hypothetical protein QNI84_16305 [Henriciella sp.]|nr:hypothetical protein [Henriciella sp.]